jgi:hypothetical protein
LAFATTLPAKPGGLSSSCAEAVVAVIPFLLPTLYLTASQPSAETPEHLLEQILALVEKAKGEGKRQLVVGLKDPDFAGDYSLGFKIAVLRLVDGLKARGLDVSGQRARSDPAKADLDAVTLLISWKPINS